MGVSAPVTSPVAAQNRTLSRLVRLLAVLLVLGTVLFVAFYLIDQRTDPGLSLVDRKVVAAEQAVRADPNLIAPRLGLAAAYTAAGRPKDAISQYDEILKISPENVAAMLGKAAVLQAGNDLGAADRLYQRVVDIRKDGEYASADNDLERAFFGGGVIAIAQQHWDSAIAALESAVRIDGSDADAWYQLGLAQLGAGVPAKAVAAERNAVAFVPAEWADPYAAMAKAYTALNNKPFADWALGMVALVEKRYADAKALLEPLAGGPAVEDAAVGLGFLAEIDGDQNAALAWYQKALARNAKNANALSGVARIAGPSALPSVEPTILPTVAPTAKPGKASPKPSSGG